MGLGRPLNLSYFKTSLICLILKLVSSLSMSCFSVVHFGFVFFKIGHLSCVSFSVCLFSCVSFSVVSPIQLCLISLPSFHLCPFWFRIFHIRLLNFRGSSERGDRK